MKKALNLFVLTGLLASISILPSKAQSKFKAIKSVVSFFSSTPIEDISATTNQTKFIVDFTTNNLAVIIPIKSFEFPQKLMQEHFNENYLESDQYPKATFKGKIIGKFDPSKPRQVLNIEGLFNIHGVEATKVIKATFIYGDGHLTVETEFDVALATHRIEVPTLVFAKIATVIKVKGVFELLRDDLGFIQLGE